MSLCVTAGCVYDKVLVCPLSSNMKGVKNADSDLTQQTITQFIYETELIST